MDAPDPPVFSTSTEYNCHLDASHAAADAKGTVNGSEPKAEMQSSREQGKKHKFQGYLDYHVFG
jgi:hypothetical protein